MTYSFELIPGFFLFKASFIKKKKKKGISENKPHHKLLSVLLSPMVGDAAVGGGEVKRDVWVKTLKKLPCISVHLSLLRGLFTFPHTALLSFITVSACQPKASTGFSFRH